MPASFQGKGVLWFAAVLLGGAAALFPGRPAEAQESEKGGVLLPLHPKHLLAALPAAPEGWEVGRSEGRSVYNGWLFSQAVREYAKLPGDNGAAATAEPVATRLLIRDTAGRAEAIAAFRAARDGADAERGDYRRFSIGEYPALAVLTDRENDTWSLRVLVRERFVIELVLDGQQSDEAAAWLKRCDFASLDRIPENRVAALPETVEIVRIDELNPRRSRTYRMATISENDVAAIARRTAAEYRKMGIAPPPKKGVEPAAGARKD